MTLTEYVVTRWLPRKTHRLSDNAVRAYRSALEHHVLPRFGDAELASLTTRVVREWLEDELVRCGNDNSVRARHGALSTVLMDAVIDGLVDNNAAHGASKRLYTLAPACEPKAMTPEERFTFLLYAREDRYWAHDLFFLASRTGLRLGELLFLQRRHVYLNQCALRVTGTYHGAGRDGRTKNKKERVVELSPDAVRCTERLLQFVVNPKDWLFPGRYGERPLHPSSVECAFERIRAAAGLPAGLSVHSLRHTYASICAARGADPRWLQAQLGHANFRITMDLYGAWLQAMRPELAALADDDQRHPPLRLVRPRVKKATTAA